jgi:hypothetical protein
MNDLLGLILLALGVIFCLSAYLLMLDALFGEWVARTQQVITTRPGRAFVVGLVNFLFFGLLVLVFLSLQEDTGSDLALLPGLLILAILVAGLSFGLAAFARLLGERLAAAKGPVHRALIGGGVLVLSTALPVAGWFLLLPYVVFTGLGAFVLVVLARRNTE